MEITPQIISKLSSANSVLIIVAGQNGDSIAAGLAMYNFLKKMEKETEILSVGLTATRFDFLPAFREIKQQLDVVKSFVIDVSTKRTQVEELSYKKEGEQLSIFIKPKKGQFTSQDVTFRNSNFPYELLILVGIDSLERLGDLYNQNTELFFETAMLNIDFRPSNEAYAQYNLINLTATSSSEIVFDLINQFEANLIDDKIATELLTGIITETDSFQHVRTTPQTFLKASQLVGLGANQQEIISRLYKSKSLGLLKLWGRVLANLKQRDDLNLVWASVTQAEFQQTTATVFDADQIIKEMESQLGFAKLFLFLREDAPNHVVGYLRSNLPLDVKTLLPGFNLTALGDQTFQFNLNQNLNASELLILDALKKNLPLVY